MGLHALCWDTRFLTGLPLVDAQHEGLIERINAFGSLVERQSSVAAAEVEALLDALTSYAFQHFADEMALQERAQVDPRFLELHRIEHARFTEDVGARRAASLADPAAARALFGFLIRWLSSHILGTDQAAARQIAMIAEGATPAEAFARAGMSIGSGSGVLSDAVDELLSVVAERNTELERLNASLHERVRARTIELEETVTQLQQTQQQLVVAGKLASVGQLASGIAHELNSPLGAAISNLGSLRRGLDDLFGLLEAYQATEPELPPNQRARIAGERSRVDLAYLSRDLPELIAESQHELRRAAAIVAELKAFSQVDSTPGQAADLNRATELAMALVPPALKAAGRFRLEAGAVEPVMATAALQQALLALLTNAAQAVRDRPASREGPGLVEVRTGSREGKVFVEVEDNGVGMSDEVRAHLFEPFFTTRKAGEGLGLGLSAAWGAARQGGGAIEVETELGKGSRFRLWLPAASPSQQAQKGVTINPYNRRKVTGGS